MRILALPHEDERRIAVELFNRFRMIFLDTANPLQKLLWILSASMKSGFSRQGYGPSHRPPFSEGRSATAPPALFPRWRLSLVRSISLLEDERRRRRVDTVCHRLAVVNRKENRLHVLWEPERRFCQRQIDSADLRCHKFSLTPEGRKVMTGGVALLAQAFGQRLPRLPSTQQAELKSLLEKLR
jgi:hypothetical protein